MPQLEHVPQGYQALNSTGQNDASVRLQSNSGEFTFKFEAVRPGLFRTTFTSPKHLLPPHRAAPIPSSTLAGTTEHVKSTDTTRSFAVEGVDATVDWSSGLPLVALTLPGHANPIHSDLPHRSYVADGTGVAHYTRYNHGTLHLGLGEKPAPMDLSNRHFVLSATDCFGYDVYRTDPMYKHIPLLINATPEGCVGIFSTSHARGFYSVGSEMDGMWGRFKVYRQEYGGLEEYLIVGKTLKEVVRIYADLVGYPLLVPRWAFGYLAGGMKYSMLDEPRASDALMEFAGKLKKHDIPCSGFQMSSGYTVAETEPKTRNVFTWNRHRFPDPAGFLDAFHKEGIRLIANVKPYVLASHPEYEKLKAAGAFFTDSLTVQSAEARLWSAGGGESGIGGHIDFTSKAGYQWWYEGIKELKRVGIDCIWNDNNEYTIPHDRWQCELTEPSLLQDGAANCGKDVGFWGRSLNTELMGRSSHDATLEAEPNQRPFILTRSATAGTLRYCASAWSGDNVTSWDGMKGANALSLTAGMCLMQCYGHDIGGFEGPQPSPELLVRWCQQGIYSPRFAINCFKTSPDNNSVGDVIEPWMYEETTPIVRDIIKRRYELIPYLYSLALESHQTATPPQRWTGWGYESDSEVWTNKILTDGETQYWLGDSLLVGGVFQPGAETAKVYLPKDPAHPKLQFLDLNNTPQAYYNAGQWVEIAAKWTESIPVLAKVGSAVPVGRNEQVLAVGDTSNPANLPLDDFRAVEIFPPKGSSDGEIFANAWSEDDGVSPPPAKISVFVLNYQSTEAEVDVDFSEQLQPDFTPHWDSLTIILPVGDERKVRMNGKEATGVEKDDLAPGAYWEDDHSVVAVIEQHEEEGNLEDPVTHQEVDTDEAIASSPPFNTNSTMSSNFTSAVVSPATAGFPSEPKNLYAEVRIDPQDAYLHVGTLRKGRLENAIYRCLIAHCPLDRGLQGCTAKFSPKCWVHNIVYDFNHDPDNPRYASNGDLIITINRAYHNPAWKGLGEASYRAIANLYRMAADHRGSCYEASFPGSRLTTMCNIPESASVGFPVNEDHPRDASEVQAMVAISISSDVRTDWRGLNLVHPQGVFQQDVRRRFKSVDLPKFAAAIGRSVDDMDTRVVLKDPWHAPACKEWWWYESSGCKPPTRDEAISNGAGNLTEAK